MGKGSYFLIGALAGAVGSAVYLYIFGPARGTTYDEKYRSRLDWALEQGEQAAAQREAELWRKFEEAKAPRLPEPPPALPGPEFPEL
jgi:hypothetical protein